MSITQQIINNKRLLEDINTHIANLLKEKQNLQNELSNLPDIKQNKRIRDTLKAKINMRQQNINIANNNKKNISNIIYALERKQRMNQQPQDNINTFLQSSVPKDEDVMDEYEELMRQTNIENEKQDIEEKKQDIEEEKQNIEEEKQNIEDIEEEKQDIEEEKQDIEDIEEEKQDEQPIQYATSNNSMLNNSTNQPNNQTRQLFMSRMRSNTRKNINNRLSFRETLKNSNKQPIAPIQINPEICKTIFSNGSKVNKKYFYPSEFPKLTKIKPLKSTISVKKGGKKIKSRKLRKK